MTDDNATRWLTRREAAEYVRVSLPTFDRRVREGKIHKFTAVGRTSPRFDRGQLDHFMASGDSG